MKSVTVRPGVVVTPEMFHKINAILRERTDHPGLTWKEFISKKWKLIPDIFGRAYKCEFLVFRINEKQTVRIHVWLGDDIRDPNNFRPHNHPWDFDSIILSDGGGYVEYRWAIVNGKLVKTERTYRTGDVNHIGHNEYHAVARLLKKPTWTIMIAGPVNLSKRWGHLDLNTLEETEWKDSDNPDFKARMAALNS